MGLAAFNRMRRLQAEAASNNQPSELDQLSVPQLKKYAKDNNFDIVSATKKADILAAIAAAQTKAADAERIATEEKAAEELLELRIQAIELGIEDAENKDAETLTAEIAAAQGDE